MARESYLVDTSWWGRRKEEDGRGWEGDCTVSSGGRDVGMGASDGLW